MKNIFKIIAFIISGFLIASCSDDEERGVSLEPNGAIPYTTDVVGGFFSLLDINNTEMGFSLNAAGDGVTSASIYVRLNSGADVKVSDVTTFPTTMNFKLTDVATATSTNTGDLALGDVFNFSFVLHMADGRNLTSTVLQSVPMACPSDRAGMYSVTTTYGYHDFLPTESSNTIDVEIKAGATEGEYMVDDFSGGLYSIGAYSSAYGTSGFPVTFRDVCGNITWSGQSDAWGACIPLAGGTNSIDEGTGVITISWFCEAYGENGVSIYTPK